MTHPYKRCLAMPAWKRRQLSMRRVLKNCEGPAYDRIKRGRDAGRFATDYLFAPEAVQRYAEALIP